MVPLLACLIVSAQPDPKVALNPIPSYSGLMKAAGFKMGPVKASSSWQKDGERLSVHINGRHGNGPSKLEGPAHPLSDPRLSKLNAKAWMLDRRLIAALPHGRDTVVVALEGRRATRSGNHFVKLDDTSKLPAPPAGSTWRKLELRTEAEAPSLDVLCQTAEHAANLFKTPLWFEKLQTMDAFANRLGFVRHPEIREDWDTRHSTRWYKGDYVAYLETKDAASYQRAVSKAGHELPIRSAARVEVALPALNQLGMKTFFWGHPSQINAEFVAKGRVVTFVMGWPIHAKHGEWKAGSRGARFDAPTEALFTKLAKSVRTQALR